jgi:hypothetical protein
MWPKKFFFRALFMVVLPALPVLLLVACDPGGRLAQLTPQAPIATPMVLGVTTEPSEPVSSTPAPIPTATYDPNRPAWTILYYAGADNNRAEFVWADLNSMEAAGFSNQIQVIAQTDWPTESPAGINDLARYVIQADDDPNQLASSPTALGEGNLGNPATLLDFLQWGLTSFPANRYALILGDFGGGWQGCCLDTDIGIPGESDHLSLTDLDQALAAASATTGNRFEVIAFSAGLMSQVDVLRMLQPYAAYTVASPSLLPGSVWDYQQVIATLTADPNMASAQFARELVTSFASRQSLPDGESYASMAAIDLAVLPRLSTAIEMLALALGEDPDVKAAIAADARRGAQVYGSAALSDFDRLASVDLIHAAAIMAELSPPGDLQDAAIEVAAAAAASVIAYERGAGCCPNGRGVSLYWPTTAETFDPLYAEVSRFPAWTEYLAAFVNQDTEPPIVAINNSPRNSVHISQPAIMRAEVTGKQIDEIAIIATQLLADGRSVLRQHETIIPAPITLPSGTVASMWPDGRHESLVIWDTIGGYLSDASGAGDYAILRAVDPSPIGPQLIVEGFYQRPPSDIPLNGNLSFRPDSGESSRLWVGQTVSSGARLVGEMVPAPGDIFQPGSVIIDDDNRLILEPGVRLLFSDTGSIFRSARPLPDGSFAVGVAATAIGGSAVVATTGLTVEASNGVEGYRAFVDAPHNVQFLYPVNWPPPESQGNITFAGNSYSSTSDQKIMQVRYYPNWTGDLNALQAEALTAFGEVSTLLQETVQIGGDAGVEGLQTAYGYESAERGERTGVFLTFLKDGVGYVVDLDGPRSQEADTLATMNTLATYWQFLPSDLGVEAAQWVSMNIGGYQMKYDPSFAHQFYNSWNRFAADPQTFIAVRIQPAGRTPAEAMTGLLNTAAEGVQQFTAEEPVRFYLGGYVWERNDFTYLDPNGETIDGLLLSRIDKDQEIAIWAEASSGGSSTYIQSTFLPIAASIQPIPMTPEG